MNKIQSIAHTFYPEGSKKSYLYGMPKPKVKCMASVMKMAVKRQLNIK